MWKTTLLTPSVQNAVENKWNFEKHYNIIYYTHTKFRFVAGFNYSMYAARPYADTYMRLLKVLES